MCVGCVCGSFRSLALHPGAWVREAQGSLQAAHRLARLPVQKKAPATPTLSPVLGPGLNLGESRRHKTTPLHCSNFMWMTNEPLWMCLCPHRSHSHRGSRRHYSRSRSRSRSYRRRSHSRSYSGERRRRSHSRSPMSNRRRHIGNRVRVEWSLMFVIFWKSEFRLCSSCIMSEYLSLFSNNMNMKDSSNIKVYKNIRLF